SLERLGEVLDSHPSVVRSVSRVPAEQDDQFLLVDNEGMGRLSLYEAGAKVKLKYTRLHNLASSAPLDVLVRYTKKQIPLDLKIKQEGRFFMRRDTLIYCASQDGDWQYRPICAVLNAETGELASDRLCLAGRITDTALFCLSANKTTIDAFVFDKK